MNGERETTLTPAQMRVLRYCTEYQRWISTLDLDGTRLLQPDDVVVIPSLIERKLLDYEHEIEAVRITPSGEVYARG